MLLPSTGFTCGTFCSNDAMLSSGTIMTVPETCAGSSIWITFSSAIMEAYSVPCAPETSASTGPGLAPRTTTTGMEVAASTPAGTSRMPVAFWPGAAVAVPTVKLFCASMEVEQKALNNNGQRSRLGFIAGAVYARRGKAAGNPCARIGPLRTSNRLVPFQEGMHYEGFHDGLPAYSAGNPGTHPKSLPCGGDRLPRAGWQRSSLHLS